MPIYEYQCHACGHTFDKLQKIDDQPLIDCPKCYKPALKKLVSAAGFQLKGTGWYATDFRDNHKKSESTNTTAPAAAPSDIKPADKPKE